MVGVCQSNSEQSFLIENHFGCAKCTYNWALALQQEYYDKHNKGFSGKNIQARLVILKTRATLLAE